jgi:hypothetical protein
VYGTAGPVRDHAPADPLARAMGPPRGRGLSCADDPSGIGGERLHAWIFAGDRSPVADAFLARSVDGIGATIMGRTMSGPVPGPWVLGAGVARIGHARGAAPSRWCRRELTAPPRPSSGRMGA